MQTSTKSFIAPAHLIRAAPRPEYSSDLDFSIIASSKCPDGLSTGIRPSSAMISIVKASITSTCEGSKKLLSGVTQTFWTMYGMVEPATNDTVKNTMMNTGSARKPTMRVRLAPIGP